MDFKKFIKSKFGKDIFSIKDQEIIKERIRMEKEVERLSGDIKKISEKMQSLILDSKGQPTTLKILNIQKIKALSLESKTKQMEAGHFLQQLQLLLLVEAMRERQKSEKESKITQEILSSDVEKINRLLMDEDVREALESGRLDKIKDKLEGVFGKEERLVDEESRELMETINDLEKVDQETAMRMAGEKAKELTEKTEEEKDE